MKPMIALIMALLMPLVVSADIINLDFGVTGSSYPAGTFSGTPAPVLGNDGDVWNALDVPRNSTSAASDPLVSTGGLDTGVSVSVTGMTNVTDLTGRSQDANIDPTFQELMIDYFYLQGSATGTITISGLMASTDYTIVLFAANAASPQCSTFTIDGTAKSTAPVSSIGTTLTEGTEYVRFDNVTSSAAGVITADWTVPDGAGYSPLCGMQIEGAFVPEPATLILLGLGGLGCIRRRRCK